MIGFFEDNQWFCCQLMYKYVRKQHLVLYMNQHFQLVDPNTGLISFKFCPWCGVNLESHRKSFLK